MITEETVTNEELSEEAVAAEAPLAEPTKRTRKPKQTDEEKAAAKAVKAANKPPKAPKEPAGPRNIKAGAITYGLGDIITLLVAANPKRGASAGRFAGYVTGQTVQQALDAGLKRADIVWDAGRGYISVSAAE